MFFCDVIVFVNERIVLKPSGFHILATVIPYSFVKLMLGLLTITAFIKILSLFKKSRPEPA